MNVHAANLRATAHAGDGAETRRSRFGVGEIQKLKERDNVTNLWHLGVVYAVMAVTIGAAALSLSAVAAGEMSAWWSIPTVAIAVLVIGASQHQLGGAIHEGTHYMLFANRRFSELASDWLAAFPIYTSTYAFRLHHLAHHQFVNDPERDPNFDQAKESGHWLDFPVAHLDFAWAVLKLLWLPNTVRYIIARAKYSAIGVDTNPYADTTRKGSAWAIRNGVLFAVGAPAAAIVLILAGRPLAAFVAVIAMWTAVTIYYLAIPDGHFPKSKIDPVISHRATAIGRMTWLGVVYGLLSAIEYATGVHAWAYYGLLWLLPLFTTFPLFMILREWLQHGNADRGKLTNTRIVLERNPLLRYAVYPWGMDYHLPHHLYASVPHYKLKDLHEVLSRDPEYREKGVVAEGWWRANRESGLPTILDILSPAYAGSSTEKHVDDATLEMADVNDKAGVQRHIEASRALG
ncbi:MAG: fatty acid desaturase family protein [Hyphomicrobium sp.]